MRQGHVQPSVSCVIIIIIMNEWTAAQPEIFYPFGVGDIFNDRIDDGSSSLITLLRPFTFFGRSYNQIYVNNNGHLTFDQSSSQYVPSSFPHHGQSDIIAPYWTDLDNREMGNISYRQYTEGAVLTLATQNIRQHFPYLTFSAAWVFIATWDKVAYFPNTNTETSFQVVLTSGSDLSFILMNYGQIASTNHKIQAGYDTINSTHYFSVSNTSHITNVTYSSNVVVPGRWVFRVDTASTGYTLGLRIRVTSEEELTESEIEATVLPELRQRLIQQGLPSTIAAKLRHIHKTRP